MSSRDNTNGDIDTKPLATTATGGMHRSYGNDHPVRNFFKIMLLLLVIFVIVFGVLYFIATNHWHAVTCTVSK